MEKMVNTGLRGIEVKEDGMVVYRPDQILDGKRKGENGQMVIRAAVTVPGSKSVTNRALLLAALAEQMIVLEGVLFSDDSRHFLKALQDLGFELEIHEAEKKVLLHGMGGIIPKKEGRIDVGSAGTAARFLTAMLALSDGKYRIDCSQQMKRRPMQPLFDALKAMGAKIRCVEAEGYLPVEVEGNRFMCENNVERSQKTTLSIQMDISKSTQFLSALLMLAPVQKKDLDIRITSEKKTGSYISITRKMLRDFGAETEWEGSFYHIRGNQKFAAKEYYAIEPDVSAACYFFAAAALTGGMVTVRGITGNVMQGDIKFLEVLQTMGCLVEETDEGIRVKGPDGGIYSGVDVNMNNFSDQALTLAVLAAYATSPTMIRSIGHIRGQECNRMQAIVKELGKCGVTAVEEGDDIRIIPSKVHGAEIETYEDHRVAMAFTLMSLRTPGIVIRDPFCCRKTFENYYEVFEKMALDSF